MLFETNLLDKVGAKKLLILLVIYWSCNPIHFLFAQNLIPNPSFEDHGTLPGFNMTSLPISYCDIWTRPNLGSPDYFHNSYFSSTSNQIPRTGDAYAGFIAVNYGADGYREYLHAPLLSPLKAGKQYCVIFYISLMDNNGKWTDDFGVYFSKGALNYSTTDSLPLIVPQVTNPDGNYISDKINWLPVSGTYTASGGENYITIGIF